jgi:hypothetical protein
MEKRNVQITIEQAREWLKNDQLKDIALEAFPELKEKSLPKKWEELQIIKGFCNNSFSEIIEMYKAIFTEMDRNVFVTKEQAEASIALAQLSQLRDVYRNGWVPNWKDSKSKYCICFSNNLIDTTYFVGCMHFLSFQDKKTRDLFLKNFKELILKAKPLMS